MKLEKMKTILSLFLIGISLKGVQAQETINLSIKEAVHQAWTASNQAKLSEEQILFSEAKVTQRKTYQYPDAEVSGKYLYLNNAKIHLKNQNTEEPSDLTSSTPSVHNFLIGQAGLSMPIFSGFRIKEEIKSAKAEEQAAYAKAVADRENIAMQAIRLYVELYEARKNIEIIQKNLKTAQQRVTDFKNMEENELLPLNDLLKAKLQQSDVKLRLSKADKDARIIQYQLIQFLKLPEDISIDINGLNTPSSRQLQPNNIIIQDRAPIQALKHQEEALAHKVKSVKGNYFPSVGVSAGYMALSLENTLAVHKAFNVGVGIAYNFSDLFKNKSKVRLAKSKQHQLVYQLQEAQDQAKVELRNASEEYQLSLDQYQLYQEAQEQAKENYRIVKDKFDNGLLNTRDLLEADEMKLQRQMKLTQARGEIIKHYYALRRTQGKLIEEFEN